MVHPQIRLVHSNDNLPNVIRRYARCTLPSPPLPTNSTSSSMNLQERHVKTFTALENRNPRLAEIIEGMTQRFLEKELEWKNEPDSGW